MGACRAGSQSAFDDSVVQAARVGHTQASTEKRLATPPKFVGVVHPGKSYIVVDDVLTSGSTVANLRHYIESKGGKVRQPPGAELAKRKGSIAFTIEGYDDDAREIYAIPAIRRF